ncbi:phosphoglycerate dehydrogenase [Psychroflexus sp. CAK57W]|uniref:phosphoglycerate dehydrogenase n=1 Tax=Psychroflexus curvus TaxID=2873595 RepID=UPI001CCA8EE3|nr:phosphoglycerate dehydrogenase [Psychroflexus curvus]MBZ9626948.1 phosphoglycerate dehydrogenase [Psychroflexus curvus]MBZ9786941.1 phosphoglycerate dehydrogenase [Psychroflexus curvus]
MSPLKTSFPKNKMKVVLLESISQSAVESFKKAGYTQIEQYPGALSGDELDEVLKDAKILGIRSKTQLTQEVIQKAKKLVAVGCFCIGTNQVDLDAANKAGICVFNAPFSNTRSVAELVIASAIMLIRRIPDKDKAAHAGDWDKSSNNSHEIRGKRLGVVGYGHIGSQVSVLAEAIGLKVSYYDVDNKLPLGNAEEITDLKTLIEDCDIITLHVPGTNETKNLLNEDVLSWFTKGQLLINMSRGDVVDIQALKKALEEKRIGGAALDVFPEEPKNKAEKFESPLQNVSNVILTPHIGGSTEEAQWNIGIDVSSKLIKYTESGSSLGSHSIPELSLPKMEDTHRILHIHKNVSGVLSEINSKISKLDVNILGQYLSTNFDVGYVVLDIAKNDSLDTLKELKRIDHTIKVRILY